MGQRGPKKTPTAVLNLRGSWRGKVRSDEPQPMGVPKKPSFIKGNAKKKWNELLEELTKISIVGSIDSTVLARYCQLWEMYQGLIDDIQKNGFTVMLENKAGDEYAAQRPEVNAAIKIASLLAKLEDSFGLTPAARAGLKINGTVPEKSALEKLLDRQTKGVKLA